MWPMNHQLSATEFHGNSGTTPFGHNSGKLLYKTFYIMRFDVGGRRVPEQFFNKPFMLVVENSASIV